MNPVEPFKKLNSAHEALSATFQDLTELDWRLTPDEIPRWAVMGLTQGIIFGKNDPSCCHTFTGLLADGPPALLLDFGSLHQMLSEIEFAENWITDLQAWISCSPALWEKLDTVNDRLPNEVHRIYISAILSGIQMVREKSPAAELILSWHREPYPSRSQHFLTHRVMERFQEADRNEIYADPLPLQFIRSQYNRKQSRTEAKLLPPYAKPIWDEWGLDPIGWILGGFKQGQNLIRSDVHPDFFAQVVGSMSNHATDSTLKNLI